ncbi:DNA alkylation repair enzyme [Fuerstiella marisgermanici]|uniref:DNA alkylation repair enzyme n=2 Tax=Fuerstiella marisgermanici TaxID=1891926 RepID=A0A1P8WEB0_9PLAN|nr:DNA alkylation repair enzyme [Fuerstiella marisgermanici]
MDLTAVMSQLKSLGTSQAVKTYKRHGAGDDVFGVSYADLKKLKKSIGPNHDLALELWQTGNVDARSLATMVADPDEFTPAHATQWMKDVTYPPHGAEVAAVIAESNFGVSKMRQWRKQKSEYARTTGYSILACLLKDDPDIVEESEGRRILKDIEMEIHRSPNRARHAMVMAVIAIGVYKPELTDDALEAGERIGEVQVDHGDTACTTPKIVAYIKKSLKRTNGRKAKIRR